MDTIYKPTLEWLHGAGALALKGTVKHGSGKREVTTHLSCEQLYRIVEFLRDWHPADYGHAFYHFTRTDRMCCSSCPQYRRDRSWKVVTDYLGDGDPDPMRVLGFYMTAGEAEKAADEERVRLLATYGREAGATNTRVIPPKAVG